MGTRRPADIAVFPELSFIKEERCEGKIVKIVGLTLFYRTSASLV